MKYSIVIPTYNHCDELLKPCIESIFKNTDLTDLEIIVVANGCTDNTREYVESLSDSVKLIWSDEPLGYTKATNLGITAAVGEYVLLLNNDVEILDYWPKNKWLEALADPMITNPKVALTGTLKLLDQDIKKEFLVFCIVLVRKQVFEELGLLDEIFSPGYGEDIDFCMRVRDNNYEWVCIDNTNLVNGTNVGSHPSWHKGNQTFKNIPEYANHVVKRNIETLKERYLKLIKYSIVIPTYNHCDDLLKPCIESIQQYSDMSNVQLIVVANGCTDNTREYLDSLGSVVETIWFDDAIGYTKATNAGIKRAGGEFTVLLNNDTMLLSQNKNRWLEMLTEPMSDPKVAMTGPLMLYDDYADANVLIFFCVMIRTKVFSEIGILDEIFSPGGGEDIDFSVRLEQAGYEIKNICDIEYIPEQATNVGNFPIWHKDNQTFKDIPEYTKYIVKRNGLINCKKYNKNIKLNLGSAGVEYPGYLSVDLYDQRAQVIMDITKLDFDENSVEEILASHVFEHLNPYKTLNILKDWLSVLKPGGKLVMEMPNIEEQCKKFVTAGYWERFGILNVIYGSVNTTDSGDPGDITSPHLFGWWPESLYNHLVAAGYTNIQFMKEQIPHPEDNMRVEAYKPK
jgi:GT2 family glycosyltransferase